MKISWQIKETHIIQRNTGKARTDPNFPGTS
jgi:hypothetical protein